MLSQILWTDWKSFPPVSGHAWVQQIVVHFEHEYVWQQFTIATYVLNSVSLNLKLQTMNYSLDFFYFFILFFFNLGFVDRASLYNLSDWPT